MREVMKETDALFERVCIQAPLLGIGVRSGLEAKGKECEWVFRSTDGKRPFTAGNRTLGPDTQQRCLLRHNPA